MKCQLCSKEVERAISTFEFNTCCHQCMPKLLYNDVFRIASPIIEERGLQNRKDEVVREIIDSLFTFSPWVRRQYWQGRMNMHQYCSDVIDRLQSSLASTA